LVEKLAHVLAALGFENETEPTPLTFDQRSVKLPDGTPSSVTVAFKYAYVSGNVTGATDAILISGG
jgi:hypothetical protein